VGRLGLTSPPSRPSSTTWPSVLRSAKTTASPSQITSLVARSPVPRQSPFVRFLQTGGGHLLTWPFSIPIAFPVSASHEELAVLSSSQATPVCTCPGLSLRWCPPVCHSTVRTHAFQHIKTVGFPRHHGLSMLSLWTTTIQFSAINIAAYALTTPGFTPNLAAELAGSLQARWLLSPGGICSLSLTHPLGNNN
jgi:hypothetical protein